MTPTQQERLKGLLGVMVRRHTRQDQPRHPVGQLIADQARELRGEWELSGASSACAIADDSDGSRFDRDDELVDRLYRRFLLPRHATVEAYAECDTVTIDAR